MGNSIEELNGEERKQGRGITIEVTSFFKIFWFFFRPETSGLNESLPGKRPFPQVMGDGEKANQSELRWVTLDPCDVIVRGQGGIKIGPQGQKTVPSLPRPDSVVSSNLTGG